VSSHVLLSCDTVLSGRWTQAFFWGGEGCSEGVHLKYLKLSPVRSLISKCDEFTCCPNSNGHVTFMQYGVKCFGGLLGRISLTPGTGGRNATHVMDLFRTSLRCEYTKVSRQSDPKSINQLHSARYCLSC